MRVLGIDEAGRGCVLGDLVVCGFLVHAPDDAAPGELAPHDLALRAAGADDSKAMTPARRLEVREALRPLGTADVRRISAQRIDGGNLNTLEEEVVVDLVRRWRPDRVVLDALGHPATLPALRARLQAALGPGLHPEWVIEPKADANHAVVGAASVYAKTERDALLDRVRAEYGDVGSGYPSDPQTKRWLEAWARSGRPWPPFVRTRWQTVAALAQPSLLAD